MLIMVWLRCRTPLLVALTFLRFPGIRAIRTEAKVDHIVCFVFVFCYVKLFLLCFVVVVKRFICLQRIIGLIPF